MVDDARRELERLLGDGVGALRPSLWVASLVYLAVFGSIIAFGTYFRLIEQVGANRASFTAVAIPVVAMALSTVFEGYRWTGTAAFGAALAFAGNYLALTAKSEERRS